MADNNQDQENEEYTFSEMDSPENSTMGEPGAHGEGSEAYQQTKTTQQKNIRRNALIVLGLIIFAMIMYKLIGMIFPGKKGVDSSRSTVPAISKPQPIQTATIQPAVTPPPVVTPAPVVIQQPVISNSDNDLKQKVSAIESSQQNVRTEITTVSEKVGTVNTNVNNLNLQIDKLNQVIASLSIQVTKQSEEINTLMARMQPKPVKRIRPQVQIRQIRYYIQAVIPGRAWLIGTNGSTLTVREGTKINGYGTVKLIDSLQGLILTSSGQTIRFSQEDS